MGEVRINKDEPQHFWRNMPYQTLARTEDYHGCYYILKLYQDGIYSVEWMWGQYPCRCDEYDNLKDAAEYYFSKANPKKEKSVDMDNIIEGYLKESL